MGFWLILYIIDWTLFIGVALTTIYLFFFSITSLFSKHTAITKAKRQNRFIILIPAYRQDKAVLQAVSDRTGESRSEIMRRLLWGEAAKHGIAPRTSPVDGF